MAASSAAVIEVEAAVVVGVRVSSVVVSVSVTAVVTAAPGQVKSA